MLGVATPDTVLAGHGAVEAGTGPGHWGPGGERPIHGQLIRVERFGGADSTTLARAFGEAGNRDVVIVPWDYDPACRTAIWSRGARWVPLDRPGTFTVRLRPRSHWAQGIPTFDAFMADIEPYPLGVFFQRGYRGTDALQTQPSLTAAQYLELYRALPNGQMLRDDPEGAAELVAAWERANPELAATYPAPQILDGVRWAVRSRLVRLQLDGIEPPLAGTYRLTLSVPDEEERTFHARTRARPTSAMTLDPRQRDPDLREPPRRPDGYSLLAAGGSTLDALPTECQQDRRISQDGYMYVVDPPLRPGQLRNQWVGKIDITLLARQFAADSALVRFARAESTESFQRYRAGLPREMPARFTRLPDGTVRVEQTITLEDGRAVTVRGERISPETVACPDPVRIF
jgi:hypothetical protein